MGHVASKFETELGERAAELAAAITTYKNELDGKVQVPGTLRCSTARLPPPLLRVQRCVCGGGHPPTAHDRVWRDTHAEPGINS